MWDYLLIYKWFLYNTIGVGALFLFNETIIQALSFDSVATPFILGLYFLFMIVGTYRIVNISRSINTLKKGILDIDLDLQKESLKYHLFSKIGILEFLSETPIRIGILGTVIGLIIISFGLEGIIGGAENAQDALAIFGQFIHGALIAFISTAAGIIMEIWLSLLMVLVRNGVGTQMQLILEIQNESQSS